MALPHPVGSIRGGHGKAQQYGHLVGISGSRARHPLGKGNGENTARQPDLANYWLPARVYEGGSGRFVSRDPAEEEVSLRCYVTAGSP